jgi:hypothetical protein
MKQLKRLANFFRLVQEEHVWRQIHIGHKGLELHSNVTMLYLYIYLQSCFLTIQKLVYANKSLEIYIYFIKLRTKHAPN